MYLHLGQNVVVPEADVIGIFDLDNATGSHITRKFLSDAEKAGKVTSVSDELPKSFILCSSIDAKRPGAAHDGFAVYLSQLSSQTLLKRSETFWF